MSSYERAIEILLERCPEFEALYEDYFRLERDSQYVIFGCVVAEHILSIADSGAPVDKDLLRRLMAVLEEIATAGDERSANLVEIGVLEDLFGEKPWGKLKGLMGPATRRLAEKLDQGQS